MNEQESAWEPEERADSYGCEAVRADGECCGRYPSPWRKRGYQGPTACNREWWRHAAPHWVCDEHKVEPQPPAYEDWLALQEASS